MEEIIKKHLERITFGDMQIHNHVAVIPLFSGNGSGPDYLTMKEAMESHILSVVEVTEGGHVPELKVQNQAVKPVLLLDGEELAGAKQNRVLNTTILLKELSETIIPVSCTEHGRWSYNSSHFEESGHIMSAKLRRVKNASVNENLKSMHCFRTDQGAVWDEIDVQARINKVNTRTGAMKDVLDAKQEDMDAFLEHFPLVNDQKGLLVLVNGEVVGLDMVSKSSAFKILHPKLIRSYVMDALTEKPVKAKETPGEKAEEFMKKINDCKEQRFDSVGYGQDFRYEGNKIVGSALVHEQMVVHMAFFQVTAAEKAGHMSSVSRRRSYRTNQ
ncbi:MAG: hypothetical protein CVU54_14525 [Deltaproteobacteria bacterium HGW-Deltaproteobacteria-12]|jgi:hypothetical protein|nr:MAG: hypothetical protein CVU54_14525 [Deltaproteobacteria bacterium HGW-Deltaproteobacteria-12]